MLDIITHNKEAFYPGNTLQGKPANKKSIILDQFSQGMANPANTGPTQGIQWSYSSL